ncbi:MAG TPA: hypothetical protein DCM05_17425 [Elusimicrobia bacterium]|nr:hypothetical protein [Elusimicrobiota bacterium]
MTFIHLSPRDLAGAKVSGLRPVPFEKGLLSGAGSLESAPVESLFRFDRLVGSWNADVPPGSSVEMSVQVRSGGDWSGWFKLARWQEGASTSFEPQADAWGSVDVDTLKLKKKADAFRYRFALEKGGRRVPLLRRIAVAVDDLSKPRLPSPPFEPGPWARELELSPLSQSEGPEELRGDICSPTALTMVLGFWGRRLSLEETLGLVLDHRPGIFGNWTLNVAAAASQGLSGEVAWLDSLSALQDEIAAGRPVVVSITFAEGELTGSPLKSTRGHLLAVAGFTPEGDVVAYDPAARDRSGVRGVYRRAEFEKAWLFNKRGLSYLLGERFPEVLRAAAVTADLRLAPKESSKPNLMDRGLGTQVLYGERVLALEAKKDWVRVEALEQEHHAADGTWHGYPGWVRAEALSKGLLSFRPDAVLRGKRTEVWGVEGLTLPLGAQVAYAEKAASVPAPRGSILLPDGRLVQVDPGHLRPLGVPSGVDRREILETAALFLGDLYVWGGRSSMQRRPGWGVDCSGLANLSYRSVGVAIPRDADDQSRRARRLRREELQPGDLVFLSVDESAGRVDHVMLYTGGEGLLESRSSSGKTLRTTFTERFGAPLSALESGSVVVDLSAAQPYRRRIFFGGFLP